MDFAHLDQQLRDSVLDLKLSNEERDELRQLGSELGQDQVRYMRNRAFDLVRELALADSVNVLPALKWLEQVIKTLDANSARCGTWPAPTSAPAKTAGARSATCAARPESRWISACSPFPTIN
ncbi:hypothetical protein PBOI14_13920 [Pseudomonas sp. Boi14]|nr:hypothetical protein PBOI14_13920 [Pseudomonas sp. Boi14]